MRPVTRLRLSISLVLTLASVSIQQAVADDEGGAGGIAKAYVDGAGNPTAEATRVSVTPVQPPAAGAPTNCTWRVLNADDTKVAMYDESGIRIYSTTGRWYQKICDGQQSAVNGVFAVPERSPSVDPGVLAQQARQSVAIPEPLIATSPRADRKLYTRVPTWLWVDQAWWRGYSATAAAGGVSTTVVATPVRAIWTMGDGSATTCQGPGVEWRPGMAEKQTNCSYVYKNASAGQRGGTFTMTVEVEFEVSWTSSIGPGGSLARITRSATRAVQVGEIQAVETE